MTNLLSSSFFLFEVVNQIHHRYFRCQSVCVHQRANFASKASQVRSSSAFEIGVSYL
jgi:hypothetical protein